MRAGDRAAAPATHRRMRRLPRAAPRPRPGRGARVLHRPACTRGRPAQDARAGGRAAAAPGTGCSGPRGARRARSGRRAAAPRWRPPRACAPGRARTARSPRTASAAGRSAPARPGAGVARGGRAAGCASAGCAHGCSSSCRLGHSECGVCVEACAHRGPGTCHMEQGHVGCEAGTPAPRASSSPYSLPNAPCANAPNDLCQGCPLPGSRRAGGARLEGAQLVVRAAAEDDHAHAARHARLLQRGLELCARPAASARGQFHSSLCAAFAAGSALSVLGQISLSNVSWLVRNLWQDPVGPGQMPCRLARLLGTCPSAAGHAQQGDPMRLALTRPGPGARAREEVGEAPHLRQPRAHQHHGLLGRRQRACAAASTPAVAARRRANAQAPACRLSADMHHARITLPCWRSPRTALPAREATGQRFQGRTATRTCGAPAVAAARARSACGRAPHPG